jgi:predicted RNA methylase
MSIDLDETFSSIDFVNQCLTDKKRTLKFEEAIAQVVQPGDVVLDSGTGSGVLALMAARAGAKKVVAVEYDPYIAKIAAKNIADNGYSDVIQIVVGDVRNAHLPEGTKFDVVIMEMLTTGMIDEFQVWTMNNLHSKGYVDASTRFLPSRQDTYIVPAHADFTNYGFTMRMVRHLWEPHALVETEQLAETALLNSVPFDTVTPLTFESDQTFEITKDGVINSVYITSITTLAPGIEVGDTSALNAPVVFPLESDLEVAKGDTIRLQVSYQFGGGFRNFSAHVSRA